MHAQIVYSDTTRKWYVPSHASAQFAGNFGFLSLGAGYDFFKDRCSFDIMAGYLPESVGGVSIFSLNSKFVYKPWHLPLEKVRFSLVPINVGMYTVHAFGENYTKLRKSGNYPQGYYWWPNSTRIGFSVGQNIFFPREPEDMITAFEFYWDLSADDLSLYSYFENEVVERKHIYHFDFGARVYF